jgi:hypothetical protein
VLRQQLPTLADEGDNMLAVRQMQMQRELDALHLQLQAAKHSAVSARKQRDAEMTVVLNITKSLECRLNSLKDEMSGRASANASGQNVLSNALSTLNHIGSEATYADKLPRKSLSSPQAHSDRTISDKERADVVEEGSDCHDTVSETVGSALTEELITAHRDGRQRTELDGDHGSFEDSGCTEGNRASAAEQEAD